jgi:TorA maturation chaperone TorD
MSTASGIDAGETQPTLDDEDRARADLYGVLARLWYAAPDRTLLDAIARSGGSADEGGETALAKAWQALSRAAADADPGALTHEYDELFVGTGRAEITLYCSHYLTETGQERVVIALRDRLRELGLGRDLRASEPEDHFAALLEVMRYLVVQGNSAAQITFQIEFFLSYIRSTYQPLIKNVLENGGARFYKDVARLTRAFLDVESHSFDMI